MNTLSRAALLCSSIAVGVTSLAACGGSASSATSSASSSAAPATSTSPPSGAGGGAALRQLYSDPQVQACLKAAGIAVPTFTPRPSGDRPSNLPSGQRPTGFPSGARPSGSGFAGGQNAGELRKVEAALKACGIAVPTFAPRSGPAVPTAPASS